MRILSALSRHPARWLRRLRKQPAPVSDSNALLATLIKVFAAFTNLDGSAIEEEIDLSLGFLRYDYPDAVYSELRKLFQQALYEQQDLKSIAKNLASELSEERKFMLGIQLCDLIARSGLKSPEILAYYSFMADLGMTTQAIDIVYQLTSKEIAPVPIYESGHSALETLSIGSSSQTDVSLKGFLPDETLQAYRYHDLVMVKNFTKTNFIIQGRLFQPYDLARIYSHQRIVCDDQVITYQDLVFYFNAKKNVSHIHIFLSLNSHNEVDLSKTRERDSSLEVVFGLKVHVIALKKVAASLRGFPLNQGAKIEASLEDKIVFFNHSELDLDDLRRRSRTFGSRFSLRASKSEYLVSNQPSLLDDGDILLTPGIGGDILLKIECDYEKKVGKVTVLQADRPIIVRGTPVRNSADLQDGDTIRIDAAQLLRCNFSDRLIEEERNIIRSLEIRDLSCRFRNGETALESISFSALRGEMICVMGASGCGKSTLLRTLSGQFRPFSGDILFNNRSLYDHFEELKKYVAHIPQFDAFDEHLTIEENLEFAAAIRSPHLSSRERTRRIDGKLAELGLNERRKSIVGSPHKKNLSGGERKRLNIGLDMIGSADIYLFDEPTSGLSSKDSEHVIEIIRSLSHNKIALVTIHQPSSKLFGMFQKVILLDKGGKLVFFGSTSEALAYFAQAEHQQQFGTNLGTCPACGSNRPEFIFDVLETPLRDLGGDIIYEENNRGQLVPARRFSPEYWRDRYEAWRLAKEVKSGSPVTREKDSFSPLRSQEKKPFSWRWREEFFQFYILLARSFVSKLRNEANLLITLIMAPVLALLIGSVLHYSESNTYDFASAFHIPAYLFLSIVVAMFLGLTNSVDDIIHDRPVLIRERNLNVRIGYYVCAKVLSLSFFAALQCLFFAWIGNWILAVRGFSLPMFYYLFLTSLSGIAIGLILSALVSESKTAVLLIPAVFIPQIILGGSFIKYEEMNRNLDVAYAFQAWFERHPETAMQPQSELKVPLICEFNPMRWSYEAIVFAQAKLNPLTSRQRQIQSQIRSIASQKHLSEQQENRLDDLKELLAILSGLEASSPSQMNDLLLSIDSVILGAPLDRSLFDASSPGFTAEQLFVNRKVVDLVSKAEMEQSDYRESRHQNVFFGPMKEYFGIRSDILTFNGSVLFLSSCSLFFLLYCILRIQLRSKRN